MRDYELDINSIRHKYNTEYERLKKEYWDISKEKGPEIKAKYEKRIKELQEEKNQQIRSIYQKELKRLENEQPSTLENLTSNEMIYIDTILRTGSYYQIESLADKYKNNAAVKDMIQATINNWDETKKRNIRDILINKDQEIESIKEALQGTDVNDTIQSIQFFIRR